MLCYAMLGCAMPRYDIYAMLCCAMLFYAMLGYARLYYNILYYTTLQYTIPYDIMPDYIMLHYTILDHGARQHKVSLLKTKGSFRQLPLLHTIPNHIIKKT